MAEYVIVIPSYKRADILKSKTLEMIKNIKVPKYIFVANSSEAEVYKTTIPKNLYTDIIIGVKGITNQRIFISKYFPEGKQILSIDDDVEYMSEIIDGKLVKIDNLNKLYIKCFKELNKQKLFLFGFYPVANVFYMEGQKPITTNLKFIIGTIHGFINRYDKDLIPSVPEKEDVQLSIACFLKDGGVLRYNHIGFKTKFKSTGGLGTIEGRYKSNKKAALYLHKKYPVLTRIKIRDNGMYEISLINPRKKTDVK